LHQVSNCTLLRAEIIIFRQTEPPSFLDHCLDLILSYSFISSHTHTHTHTHTHIHFHFHFHFFQTCLPDTRENATVSSSDVAALLQSRYSLRISTEDALNIVRSFGGGDTRVLDQKGKRILMSSGRAHLETSTRHLFGRRGNGVSSSLDDHPPSSSSSSDIMKSDTIKPIAQNRPPATEPNNAKETNPYVKIGREDPINGGGSSRRDETERFSYCADNHTSASDDDAGEEIYETVFCSRGQNQNYIVRESSNTPSNKHVHFKSLAGEPLANGAGTAAAAQGQKTLAAPPEEGHHRSLGPTCDQDGTTKAQANNRTTLDSTNGPVQSTSASVEGKDVWNDEQEGEEEQQQQQQQHDEYLDLVQILSVILMPTIARAADEDKNGPEPHKIMPVPADDANYFIRKVYYPIMSFITDLDNTHYEKQRPKPKGKAFFDHALAVLLKDVTASPNSATSCSSREGPPMTEELVRDLLLTYGEVERAENAQLIREMVKVAQSSSGRLDREALIHALSSDLSEFKVGSEDKLSTFLEDVFGESDPRAITSLYQDRPSGEDENNVAQRNDEEEAMGIVVAAAAKTTTTATALRGGRGGIFDSERTSIDMVCDSTRSLWTHVLIFMFFLLK
jgi:hypothetical protein